MPKHQAVGFELSISARDDGTPEAAYIQFSNRAVARTQDVLQDILLADYDRSGGLVGLEILARVKLSELAKLVDKPRRTPFKRFIQASAPRQLLAG